MIDKKGFSFELYEMVPVIGIMRNLPAATVLKVAQLFVDTGFTNLEITMNTNNAIELIKRLRQSFPQINIGAGTVTKLSELHAALESGAQFIVTPVTIKELIEVCVSREIPVFPGAYTPTEIYQAWEWGATAVKVFPANELGPGYIKNVLAPLNKIKLVPTGGVHAENLEAFFLAGASAVGLGGGLFDKALIEEQDWNGLKVHFQHLKDSLKEAIETDV